VIDLEQNLQPAPSDTGLGAAALPSSGHQGTAQPKPSPSSKPRLPSSARRSSRNPNKRRMGMYGLSAQPKPSVYQITMVKFTKRQRVCADRHGVDQSAWWSISGSRTGYSA
jgi:hypothetical protein